MTFEMLKDKHTFIPWTSVPMLGVLRVVEGPTPISYYSCSAGNYFLEWLGKKTSVGSLLDRSLDAIIGPQTSKVATGCSHATLYRDTIAVTDCIPFKSVHNNNVLQLAFGCQTR
jgi:hypothetical protein